MIQKNDIKLTRLTSLDNACLATRNEEMKEIAPESSIVILLMEHHGPDELERLESVSYRSLLDEVNVATHNEVDYIVTDDVSIV